MAGLRVRPFAPGDAAPLRQVFESAVHTVARRDYSAVQCEAWASRAHDPAGWATRMASLQPFVAEVGADIAGFASLQPTGYIDMFFVSGAFGGRGVGQALMRHIEAMAASQRLPLLWANVSLRAEAFFGHHGFVVEQRQEIERAGVLLRNARMTRTLCHPATTAQTASD